MADKKPHPAKASAASSPLSKAQGDTTSPAKKRTRIRYNMAEAEAQPKEVQQTQLELIEANFAYLTTQGEELARRFFERLFEVNPELRALFQGVSINGQQKKFFTSLVLIVQSLRQPEILKDYLWGLGARHVHYGVQIEHYPIVIDNLLAVMQELSGEQWTPELDEAWAETIRNITDIMMEPAESEPEAAEDAVPLVAPMNSSEDSEVEAPAVSQTDVGQSILDQLTTPVLSVDTQGIISYLNPAMEVILATHDTAFNSGYLGLNKQSPIGKSLSSILPEMKEMTLPSDPSRGAISHELTIGSSHYMLKVSMMMDNTGRVTGNTIEWVDNTVNRIQQQHHAEMAELLESSVDMFKAVSESGQQGLQQVQQQLAASQELMALLTALKQSEHTFTEASQGSDSHPLVWDASLSSINSAHQKLAATASDLMTMTDKMTTLDELIFQVNLLTLNTAVEAAKLGEQGRGFSVLSAELRALTQNASTTLQEIKLVLAANNEQAREGQRLVQSSVDILTKTIEASSEPATNAITDNHPQTTRQEDMAVMIDKVAEATDKNSLIAEQMETANQSIEQQLIALEQLMDELDQF